MEQIRFISASCQGERCSICGKDAAGKVEETIFHDDPQPIRHPLTAYVCREHLDQIMDRTGYTRPAPPKPDGDAGEALENAIAEIEETIRLHEGEHNPDFMDQESWEIILAAAKKQALSAPSEKDAEGCAQYTDIPCQDAVENALKDFKRLIEGSEYLIDFKCNHADTIISALTHLKDNNEIVYGEGFEDGRSVSFAEKDARIERLEEYIRLARKHLDKDEFAASYLDEALRGEE